jgi:hypothetical protein
MTKMETSRIFDAFAVFQPFSERGLHLLGGDTSSGGRASCALRVLCVRFSIRRELVLKATREALSPACVCDTVVVKATGGVGCVPPRRAAAYRPQPADLRPTTWLKPSLSPSGSVPTGMMEPNHSKMATGGLRD